jgi:hypothetical protein
VGPHGLLQPLADGLKFLFKEDMTPRAADKIRFHPGAVSRAFAGDHAIALIPFGPPDITIFSASARRCIADVLSGLLFLFAITSIGVYGVALAGWSSNSKYSLLGGLRSSAQMISYELALTLSVVGVLLMAARSICAKSSSPRDYCMGISAALELIAGPIRRSSAFCAIFTPPSRKPIARPSICRKPKPNWWPAFTRNIPASSSRCFSWRIREHDHGLLPRDDSVSSAAGSLRSRRAGRGTLYVPRRRFAAGGSSRGIRRRRTARHRRVQFRRGDHATALGGARCSACPAHRMCRGRSGSLRR